MSKYTGFIIRRLIKAVFVVLGIAVLAFFLIRLAPGDAVDVFIGDIGVVDPAIIEGIRHAYGLDKPLLVQLFTYIGNVLRFDLGYSYRQQEKVILIIAERLPATLLLAGVSLAFAILVGMTLGTLAARRVGKWTDTVISASALVVYATPSFWLGLMAILAFAVYVPILPPFGMARPGVPGGGWSYAIDVARHLVLPALTLGLFFVAIFTRLTRAQVLEVADMDFVRTARAKGVPEARVIRRHVLRNALLPVVTYAGYQAGNLVSGAVLVETVFAWPGIGRLAYDSLIGRDYNMMLGIFIVTGALVVLFNLLTDLAYTVIDPRIELEH